MNTTIPLVATLATYFRPAACITCRKADARTACGSSYCVSCWEDMHDTVIGEEECACISPEL